MKEDLNPCPFHEGRYLNPHLSDSLRSIWDFFKWWMGSYEKEDLLDSMPHSFQYPIRQEDFDPNQPTLNWINHSTFLIQAHGIHILTDPIWGKSCSPISWLGPQRNHEPPISIADLPHIDCVLISHDHYDHLDKTAVKELRQRFPDIVWVVPLGVEKLLLKWGIQKVISQNVISLDWWEHSPIELKKREPHVPIRVTAVPSQHFSGRSLFDQNKTLWCGFVLEIGEKKLYFVGDTGYNEHDFKKIGKRFGSFDLSLIPIGTYIPRTFMSPFHIEPKHSVAIHKEVNSKKSIGMHWKTFRLSEEPLDRPPYDLFVEMQKEGLDPTEFLAIEPGIILNW